MNGAGWRYGIYPPCINPVTGKEFEDNAVLSDRNGDIDYLYNRFLHRENCRWYAYRNGDRVGLTLPFLPDGEYLWQDETGTFHVFHNVYDRFTEVRTGWYYAHELPPVINPVTGKPFKSCDILLRTDNRKFMYHGRQWLSYDPDADYTLLYPTLPDGGYLFEPGYVLECRSGVLYQEACAFRKN